MISLHHFGDWFVDDLLGGGIHEKTRAPLDTGGFGWKQEEVFARSTTRLAHPITEFR